MIGRLFSRAALRRYRFWISAAESYKTGAISANLRKGEAQYLTGDTISNAGKPVERQQACYTAHTGAFLMNAEKNRVQACCCKKQRAASSDGSLYSVFLYL